MPFVEAKIEQEIEKRRKNDADFREAWDNSREEYRLIEELVSLRKQNNITQKELTKLSNDFYAGVILFCGGWILGFIILMSMSLSNIWKKWKSET